MVASGCQLASCRPSPLFVNHTTIWTGVSGYHSADPRGQGDFMVQGASLLRTRIAPMSVGSAARPVASILRGQPGGIGVDRRRFGAGRGDSVVRTRGTGGSDRGTAEPDASQHDHDEQGAAALPEGPPGPWDTRSCSCDSRHNVNPIVMFEDRAKPPLPLIAWRFAP